MYGKYPNICTISFRKRLINANKIHTYEQIPCNIHIKYGCIDAINMPLMYYIQLLKHLKCCVAKVIYGAWQLNTAQRLFLKD